MSAITITCCATTMDKWLLRTFNHHAEVEQCCFKEALLILQEKGELMGSNKRLWMDNNGNGSSNNYNYINKQASNAFKFGTGKTLFETASKAGELHMLLSLSHYSSSSSSSPVILQLHSEQLSKTPPISFFLFHFFLALFKDLGKFLPVLVRVRSREFFLNHFLVRYSASSSLEQVVV